MAYAPQPDFRFYDNLRNQHLSAPPKYQVHRALYDSCHNAAQLVQVLPFVVVRRVLLRLHDIPCKWYLQHERTVPCDTENNLNPWPDDVPDVSHPMSRCHHSMPLSLQSYLQKNTATLSAAQKATNPALTVPGTRRVPVYQSWFAAGSFGSSPPGFARYRVRTPLPVTQNRNLAALAKPE